GPPGGLGALDEPPLLALRQREAGGTVAHAEGAAHLRLGARTVGDEEVPLDGRRRRGNTPCRADLAPRRGKRAAQGLGRRKRRTIKRATHRSMLLRPGALTLEHATASDGRRDA